jgi:hypothetical protein
MVDSFVVEIELSPVPPVLINLAVGQKRRKEHMSNFYTDKYIAQPAI